MIYKYRSRCRYTYRYTQVLIMLVWTVTHFLLNAKQPRHRRSNKLKSMSNKICHALSQSKFTKRLIWTGFARVVNLNWQQCGQEIKWSARSPNYKSHCAYSKMLQINHSEKSQNKSLNSFELKAIYLTLQVIQNVAFSFVHSQIVHWREIRDEQ